MRTKQPNQAEKMLSAAAHLFARQEFHDVRMGDIALAAGLGKGTLYRYYKDKDALYCALLERAAKDIQLRLSDAIAKADTYRKKLTCLIASAIAYFDEQPHVAPMIQRCEVLQGLQSPWQPAREAIMRTMVEIFAGAAEAGEFRVKNSEQNAIMLFGGARCIVLFGKQPRPAGLAESIVTDFLCGAAVFTGGPQC